MNMCPTYKRKLPPELCLKGQIFFILSNSQNFQIALEKIPLLGGRIDTFLSKDITTILIEDVHLVPVPYLPNELDLRPSYNSSGIIASNFPHPNVVYNLPSTSRGCNFISGPTNYPYRVIVFAQQWGIQVLGISYFLSTLEPYLKSLVHQNHSKKNQNISNLNGCFIKFECFHKKFKPCYKVFSNDPERLMPLRNANILIKPETCNVILDKSFGPRHLQLNYMDRALYNIQDCKPLVKGDKKFQKLKPKEENNYCECCKTHFNDLKTHIKSANHLKFVANEKNYESVNNILKMLPSPQEFIQKHQKCEQSADLMKQNGDTVHNAVNSVTDFSMALNLQVEKTDSPLQLLPLNLHVKKDQNSVDLPIPLNLHLDQHKEIKQESPAVHIEPDPVFIKNDINSVCKSEIDVVGIKPDSPPIGDTVDCKEFCIPEMTNELLFEQPISDLSLDKTNTAALAQLCIKNLENCWMDNMDNLPDMDDMMFDDNIFDFDDSKQKSSESECQEQDQFSPDINSPGLVSGISENLKGPSNANTSLLLSTSVDIKDIDVKLEPHSPLETDLTGYSPICKSDPKFEDTLSPSSLRINQSIIENKLNFSGSFDIKSNTNNFYSEKQDLNMNSPCPDTIPVKISEQMFSSESSDDDNGNVLISNALNIITTNSDSEMKIDKDAFADEELMDSKSIVQQSELKISGNSEQNYTSNIEVSDSKNNDKSCINATESAQTKPEVSCIVKAESPCISEAIMNIPVNNENIEKSNTNICADDTSLSSVSYTEMINPDPIKISSVATTMMTDVITSTNMIDERNTVVSNVNNNPIPSDSTVSSVSNNFVSTVNNNLISGTTNNSIPASNNNSVSYANSSVSNSDTSVSSINHNTRSAVCKNLVRSSQHSPKPDNKITARASNTSKEQKIVNNTFKSSKKDKEMLKTHSNSSNKELSYKKESGCINDFKPRFKSNNSQTTAKHFKHSFTEKYLSTCVNNTPSVNVNNKESIYDYCEEKVSPKAERMTYISTKEKLYKKGFLSMNRHEAYIKAQQDLPKSKKLPPKKSIRKMRKLPSLWSVSILPGKGIKLKFTCLQPESFVTIESDEDGSESVEASNCQ
ncbi:DBF4-type domain-containing protein [Trichonephila clavipes]|nr:DBF4-type domain-containing protein [Trichonephila clavipes]